MMNWNRPKMLRHSFGIGEATLLPYRSTWIAQGIVYRVRIGWMGLYWDRELRYQRGFEHKRWTS